MTKYIELAYDTIEHETESATLFEMGEEKPVWIPNSIIGNIDKGTVTVAEWWAITAELV